MSTSGGPALDTGTISEITSTGMTITVTDPEGPTTNIDIPAAAPIPGQLLATHVYSATHTFTVAASTLTALDTTNATLAFTIPADGDVDIDVQGFASLGVTSTSSQVTLALLNHTGGAQVGNSVGLFADALTSTNIFSGFHKRFHITGLSAGAYQVDVAAAVTNASGTSASIIVDGLTGLQSAGAGEPLLIQAFAA